MSSKEDHSIQVKALQEKLMKLDKLASLGMLSAGIMHEIQNPMNFIVNFSKMSKDLLNELVDYISSLDGLKQDELEELEDISSMIKENLGRVLEHSDRANNIIQSMLAYSRGRNLEKSGVKINQLVSQFVNLGYHAMRANYKGFNVKITESYDEQLTEIKAIDHDLGRAILNLVNNACFAVFERTQRAGADYKPELVATTRAVNSKVEISIRDNGTGIPEEVLADIYRPFFSTKPEKEGTGLGLTITREIVEEKHDGKLEVVSKPGEGTSFTIVMSIK